jgi:hypothetical protein
MAVKASKTKTEGKTKDQGVKTSRVVIRCIGVIRGFGGGYR